MVKYKILLVELLIGVAALPREQETIQWRPCPELNQQIAEISAPYPISQFDCAHLDVPLDYSRRQTSDTLQLDLFRVNATKEPVLGSVLFNPGGPGQTGAESFALVSASDLHLNIGGQFNLISWDPRGTGNTIPFNSCSTSDTTSSSHVLRRAEPSYHNIPSSNISQNFIDVGWEQSRQLAEACYATNNQTGQFIGTGSVAHDMLSIVDALGEDGLLRYYGWSYGSALGMYFAAMFPERVDRMLLDGNVNPHTWQKGTRPEAFEDVDKAFAAFVDECWKNGDECALVTALNATSKSDIWDTLDAVYSSAAANTNTVAGFNAYIQTLGLVSGELYYPMRWPLLAETLAELLTGKAIYGIRCSDATFQVTEPEEYMSSLNQQLNHSKGFGALYNAVWPCASWKLPDKQQYRGDFKVKSRHPILMVNGEYDPSTPISGAYNASSALEGSVVLAHKGYGHGIFPSPSKCVAEYIQRYFVDGDLPENGVVCEPDFGPWELGEFYAANNISRPF